jgi:sulfur-carrier protein
VPVFRIPGPLRSLSGGEATVTVDAGDLRSAIDQLDARFPGFRGRLLDDDGQPRQFVNLFLNDEDVRLGRGLDAPVTSTDEIAIVPAVAGGALAG